MPLSRSDPLPLSSLLYVISHAVDAAAVPPRAVNVASAAASLSRILFKRLYERPRDENRRRGTRSACDRSPTCHCVTIVYTYSIVRDGLGDYCIMLHYKAISETLSTYRETETERNNILIYPPDFSFFTAYNYVLTTTETGNPLYCASASARPPPHRVPPADPDFLYISPRGKKSKKGFSQIVHNPTGVRSDPFLFTVS